MTDNGWEQYQKLVLNELEKHGEGVVAPEGGRMAPAEPDALDRGGYLVEALVERLGARLMLVLPMTWTHGFCDDRVLCEAFVVCKLKLWDAEVAKVRAVS